MEQAIAVLGRSVLRKRETRDNGETVSFHYRPDRGIIPARGKGWAAVTVYVRYFSDGEGVRVRVTVMPTVWTMLFFLFGFAGVSMIAASDFSLAIQFFLVSMIFYVMTCWVTVETKNAVRSFFSDAIVE